MKIRKARIIDAITISRLIQNTLEKINSADYSPDEIRAWKNSDTSTRVKNRIQDKNRYMCVAIKGNKIVGVGSLKGNEISAIYIKADRIGKGVGSFILSHIEKTALRKGIKELKMDSSLTAVNFYKKHGYKKARNSYHQFGNIKLKCVVMKKLLRKDELPKILSRYGFELNEKN